jgi:alpha-beta hydrolase superfamily lysophospholipase
MYKSLIGLLGLLIVAATIPIAVVVLDAPASPPPMPSMAPPATQIREDFPAPRHFQARDGASLQYYAYPAQPNKVAVLVHGSASPATSMHALAQAMHAAGITVYVPDIRGHGGSGRRGDIDYVGQIDDDLADFVGQLGLVNGETRTLVGFSAGAGFSIRFAGGPYGGLFDSYVFLAPILPGAPTLRPNAGGWTSIALARITTIVWLNRLGIHWFDSFPVVRYAISPENARSMTGSYSFRLSSNFGAGRQHANYLSNIRRPAAILVGDADEQVVADQYAPLLQRLGLTIPVTVVPNMTHSDMIKKPEAFRAILSAMSRK